MATAPPLRRVIVVGSGIAGLAAAHRLKELATERGQSIELLLLESGARPGGIIGTALRDGFLLEDGPDSFFTEKPWALALCRRLGLESQLIGTNSDFRRSFILRGSRLVPVPEGFHMMAPARLWPFLMSPLLSWPGRLRVLSEWLVPPRPAQGDESLASFVERRLGREALERVAQPMISGIYGADPRALSLGATMPRFLEMERTHGGVIRGLLARQRLGKASGRPAEPVGRVTEQRSETEAGARSDGPTASQALGVSGPRYGLFLTLKGGMQTLTDALASRLPPESLRLNSSVRRLSLGPDGKWQLTVGGPEAAEETLTADAVCLAVPSYHAASLLKRLYPALAAQLEAIRYTSSATLNLAYRREDIRHALDGFGFVVPSIERRSILGCTFSSIKFPNRAPAGHVLLRAFIGAPDAELGDPADLAAAAQSELEGLLGISAQPLFTHVWQQSCAVPQYEVGHLDRVDRIEAATRQHHGLALAGAAFRGIGVPDCIHSGEQAAERLMG